MRDILNDLDDGRDRDPIRAAQEAMRTPLPKRFYTDVGVATHDEGFVIHLDGRPARTPGKALIALKTEAAAKLIAAEFAAQADEINPATMPAWRLVNTAIDGVVRDPQAVIEDIVRFFGSDLVCYRADGPDGLVAAQRARWDGALEWAEAQSGGRFILAEGVMHVTQPKPTIAAMGALINQIDDPVALAALHSMTTLTGSAILAYGVARGAWSAADAWAMAHVDEDFNIAQWGEDAEAAAMRAGRWLEMEAAALMLAALDGAP